jgi:hypothetical protein
MPTLYVPWKKPSEINPEDTLISVGFTAVDVEVLSDGVRITKYDDHPARQNRKNEGYSILVSNHGTLHGEGSRLYREWVLNAYEWYRIATGQIKTTLSQDFVDRLLFNLSDDEEE